MAEFQIGEEVLYTRRLEGMMDTLCTVIAEVHNGYYLQPNTGRYNLWTKIIRTNHEDRLVTLPDRWRVSNFNAQNIISAQPCVFVGKRSRNIKSTIMHYDPKQQGDREDDV